MKSFKFSCLIVSAVALAGCQSFPLTSWMFKKGHDSRLQSSQLAGNTSGALEEGAAYLRAGQISEAVASYRIALLDPATRAEANNGLAVAYARLGRDDLADRYFRSAMELEPENSRFAANLLRLHQHQRAVLAQRVEERELREPAIAADASARNVRQVATTSAPSKMVERVSRGEVHLHTRVDQRQPPQMIVAEVERSTAPLPVDAPPSSSQKAYPVRIVLSQ